MFLIEVSRAFQTALSVITTNSEVARQCITGELQLLQLHPALTSDDVQGLRELLSGKAAAQVLASAQRTTARRRRRVVASLPMTARVLGERFEQYWQSYLGARAPRGVQPAAVEGSLFAQWVLQAGQCACVQPDLIGYELCRCAVAERFVRRFGDTYAQAITPEQTHVELDSEERCVRLSQCARVERFRGAVDEAVRHFRSTRELSGSTQGKPVDLIFHACSADPAAVEVTRISRQVRELLEVCATAMPLRALLSEAPAANRPRLRGLLQKLLDMRILDMEA